MVMKRWSDGAIMLHVYSPFPLGKLQNDIYKKYVLESNQDLY